MIHLIKKFISDTKSIPTGVTLVVLVVFLRSFGWGFVDPFLSIFLDGFSSSYTGVGSLISVMAFVSLLTLIPLVRVVDHVKETTILRDGEVMYLITIILFLAAGFSHNLILLIFALASYGMAIPLFMLGAESYIRKYGKSAGETKSFALYTALNYLGWILGMLIAAYTVQYYGLNWMFIFILPAVLLGFIILTRIHERGIRSLFAGFHKYFHRRQDFEAIINDFKALNKRTTFFLILAFFDGVIIMFSYIFIPLFALSVDLSYREIALLMAAMYLPFIFSFVISEVTDKLKRMDVIATGLFIGGLSFVFLGFVVDQMWIVILVALKSLSQAIIRPAYNGMITHLTPRRMLGEITGINNFSMRTGIIVGPIVMGLISDKFGIQFTFLAIAIFAFILSGITLLHRGYESLTTK